ncbi:MAG: 50S ribosomal protein L18 [Dehalococcoidales bacterium]|nr:50S ribosomal protein L18 [Dehalococcoidales bacterium]
MVKDSRRVARLRRHVRVRQKIKGTSSVPRLCVFRSPNHIYAQVIDDTLGHTLAAASTLDPEVRGELTGKTKTARSELVGTLIAKRAKNKGVEKVAFDRGGFKYHGRVKALADAARQEGLKF